MTVVCWEQDDFHFDIVNFLYLDDDIPLDTPYVYTFFIRFSCACCQVSVFNNRNKHLLANILKHGYLFNIVVTLFWKRELVDLFFLGLWFLSIVLIWSCIRK